MILLATQDSINLLGILSLDSSLYHVMSSSRPFFNAALTLAIFHWSGGLQASALCFTHVQYTQTDTIRQTDGPLVPMVRLVPMEKHPIPIVLLVNMHLIKGT